MADMQITNQTNNSYTFGPYVLPAGIGQTVTIDTTTNASLYLTNDAFADIVNALYSLTYITALAKWLFIGRSPALSTVNTQQSPSASGSYVDLATSGPSFTAPRAGSYYVEWGASASAQSNAGLSTASMIVTNASNTQWGTDVAVTNNGGGVAAGIWSRPS
jgi:hypothetical protein